MAGDTLTDRERDVLELLRRGLTNNEIAAELDISTETAKDHVSSILHKLKVRSRDEASYWPERAPWWARAPLIAPLLAFLRRSARGGSPSLTQLAGALLALVAIVVAIFAVLVFTTGGKDEEAPPGRWLSLLAQIPDVDESRLAVVMNDYAEVRELFGVERPPADADEEGLIDYYVELLTKSRGSWLAEQLGNLQLPGVGVFTELRTEFGFTIADIDLDAVSGDELANPVASTYYVARGRISEPTVVDALRTDPTFSEILETASYNDVEYYHWGRDGIDVERVTAVRPLGEAGQVMVLGDAVYRTKRKADMEAWIDAMNQNGPSLGDSRDYRLLATALDELRTYSAFFSSDVSGFTVSDWEEWAAPEEIAADTVLKPFVAYATGTGRDFGGDYYGIVLLHEDSDAASENAIRLRSRATGSVPTLIFDLTRQDPPLWKDVTGGVQTEARDKLVLAKIYIVSDEMPNFRYLWRDTLLIHE